MAWSRGPTIGRGSSATVSLANMASGDVFAVKSAELTCSTSLQKEQSFISQLSSPYIVKYMGFDITCENKKIMYNLFIEYMPRGTLADLIKKHGGSLEESLIKLYAHQILKGLNYLHLNGIAHCDIKGSNILVGKDGVKIADLGCAKMVENRGTSAISGTPMFMAPEAARGEGQGFAADIWSFGCTVIEMATGSAPWPNMNDPVSALYKIGYSDDVIEFHDWLSNTAKDFLGKCFKRNPEDRWTAKQLLQHPFFDGIAENNQVEDAKLARNSPTSILEQGLWDSMEMCCSEFSCQVLSENDVPLDSRAERIEKLVSSSDSELTNWTMDENWVTVRGIINEESTIISEQNLEAEVDYEELMDLETPLFSFASEEELERSAILEDLLSHFIYDVNNGDGSFTDRTSPVNSLGSGEDEFVSASPDFVRKAIRKLLILLVTFIKDPLPTFMLLILS